MSLTLIQQLHLYNTILLTLNSLVIFFTFGLGVHLYITYNNDIKEGIDRIIDLYNSINDFIKLINNNYNEIIDNYNELVDNYNLILEYLKILEQFNNTQITIIPTLNLK